MSFKFETAIEKLGRILASQYNISVQFEGDQAYTDGEKIVLPYIQNMSKDLYRDLNGYLDHEVAHCKFTTFNEMSKAKNRMHKELLNAAEDVRIEKAMKEEFPGTAFNLDPLNEKLRTKMSERWSEMEWPVRTIIAIRDIMEGRAPKIDKDIERYIDVVKDSAIALRKCKNTTEIQELTAEIIKKIIDEREEEKKEEEKGDEGDKKKGDKEKDSKKNKGKGKGEGEKDKDGEGDSEKDDDEKEGEGDEKEKDSEGDKEDGKSNGDSGEPEKEESKADRMLSDSADSKESDWNDEELSVHDMMDSDIKKEVGSTSKVKPDKHEPAMPSWNDTPSIPVTTRFDKVTDHSGKGNTEKYAKLKREIMPLVNPIKSQLERILKVQENARWRRERERGALDSRALSKLTSRPGYRTPFRDFSKTETTNVAVQILVDMSGSMGGRMQTAKKAAIALGESLKDLGISFEVTGFYSEHDSRVAKYAKEIGASDGSYYSRRSSGKRSRFNRVSERLDLHIFKSFDSHSLHGIEKMFVGSQNQDGECVLWAAKRLALRKEKRKILLVLSDGEPAADCVDHAILCSDLKNKVKAVQKSGIECIGIGIETDCVKHYYPDYVVLNDVKDLPKKAMRKLSSLIAKGS